MSKVIVVGGGIAGLSAAWALQKAGVDYALLEKSERWGGKVHTKIVELPEGKAIIDGGPESFVTRKTAAWDLAGELGIQDQVINPGAETSHMYILDGGTPVEVPLAPFKFVASPIMSGRGKLRMLTEPFQPPKADDADESLADFVTRRLGREALEKFMGPILGGIYNTDPEKQSILVSSPIMREMEAEYGGLVKAVVGKIFAKNKPKRDPNRPRFGAFASGLEVMVTELVAQLTGDLRLNVEISGVAKNDAGYVVTLANGDRLAADALIFATPANATAAMLAELAPGPAQKLATIEHKNIGTITLIYKTEDAQTKLHIHGLMIPRREKRAIDAITFTSLKMPSRSPQGYGMVRVFFGGSQPGLVEMSDADLLENVRAELKSLLGITASPLASASFRWLASFPQADVGHLAKVAEIESALPEGIYVTGSSYRGIGVPDCIQQANETVEKIIEK